MPPKIRMLVASGRRILHRCVRHPHEPLPNEYNIWYSITERDQLFSPSLKAIALLVISIVPTLESFKFNSIRLCYEYTKLISLDWLCSVNQFVTSTDTVRIRKYLLLSKYLCFLFKKDFVYLKIPQWQQLIFRIIKHGYNYFQML